MRKRLLAGLIAAAISLAAASFTACGFGGGESENQTETGGGGNASQVSPVAGTKGLAYAPSGDGRQYFSAGIGICTETEIEIANTYNGLPVTEIGREAFSYCDALTSVTIPRGVTGIGDYAFYYCGALTEIAIPDSVASIGVSAFNTCGALTEVTIPDSVASIGSRAFYGCGELTRIEFGGTKNEWIAMKKGENWYGYSGLVVQCSDGKLDKSGNEIAE